MINIQHISKEFGKLKALNDINVTLEGGECIALIGPNGSGKTTLIKTILGMVVPSAGQILFDGQSIEQKWIYRNEIGYMPQIGQYPENMTIAQVLDMMKDIRKMPENKLDLELYHAFNLPALLSKRMGTLSGGTRQKVSACLAFMFSPKALILDEPTAGLDPLSTEILKDKIQREKEKNKLIIISSHVLSDLDDMVSQIVYLQDGKLIFHKTLQQLKEDTGTQKLSKAIAHVMSLPNQPNEGAVHE
ncbi:ATP-binding cassette domain-containing protein [Sphingobacterium sp. DK4209]|uniref:ATP-binding cassette domain-containing protein n=1 Tax=Sphingobacterium zhuxiongii TaxID=2662364 RepID=A0A5Q0QAQ3_9SPHI|nr:MULTISPECIES: ABC transporter ATP-binding protein [unclassified Sphingobacterium]MVZ64657.1 ATP-binding cassette domain-containing protein [Sphingobacterium sp. DK4209]QGA26995.1 ATP-binding cassette domain-containing protein [Sphingobacterium sp. dk4302]